MKKFKTEHGGCGAFSLLLKGERSKTHSLPLYDVVEDAITCENEGDVLLFMSDMSSAMVDTIPYIIFLRVYQIRRRHI